MHKKSILFLLFLLFTTSLNAAEITFVNAMPIYLYGSVSSFATVYEFIGAVVTDPTVHVIFALGVTIQVFLTGMRARTGDVSDIGKSLLAPITLYALFFVPTVNVHITDLRMDKGLINYSVPDGGYRKVDDIPYAIAFIPASSSLLVSLFIDLIDDNWNSVNLGSKFSSLGFQEMSRISQEALVIAQLEDLNISNVTVYNMNQYVSTCLVTEALKTPTNRQKLIHPSKTFPEMYNPANFDGNVSSTTVTLTLADNLVFSDTCAQFYTDYVSGVATEIEDGMETLLSQKFPTVDVSGADFNEAWREQSGVEQSIVGNIRVAMATTAVSRALERTLSIEGIGVDGVSMATEIGIETTIANLRTEGLAKFEWLSRMLPNAINIILMIILGAFPLMIMVMSFFGKDAGAGITKYFMGYIAMNFNLVSLALVSNIISYYTAQNAQQAIVSYGGMPFGLIQVSDFMFQQADMAGLAGLIGAVSVFAVTPLIFMGETAGFAAAVGAVGSAFRGNVVAGAKDALVEKDSQAAIDAQALEAKNERDAAAWLIDEGYPKPSNMNAVEAKNQLIKNLSSIGNANAASEIFHSGNAQNFISGAGKQASQSMNKTAGLGSHEVSMATAGSVAFEDGEVMGSMVNNTARLRNESESYNPSDVGTGQAIGQFGKDMGSTALSKLDPNANATVANATNAVANQVGAGQGLLETGAFNDDGTLAGNDKTEALIKGAALSSAQKASEQIGAGATGYMQDFLDKGLMDGSRNANATNKASQIMKNGVDADGNALYDEDRAAQGQAMKEVAAHNKNMQTADAADFGRTGEVTGVGDYISGAGAQDRIAANDAIGVGEKWQNMTEDEKIVEMAKVKDNSVVKTFGGIDSTNAEIMKHGGVDGAINDMVTQAQKKGIDTAADSSKLRENYDTDRDGDIDDSKAVINEKQKNQARQDKADAKNELDNIAWTNKDESKVEALKNKIKAADDIINNNESMTLSEQASEISQSKIDSTLGQAIGINENRDAGVNYAENAMYGEMSKQQSTQAKLDAQGGVDGAVGIDVMEAGQKASAQKGAVEGLQGEAQKIGEEIGKSAAKVMEDTANVMARGKIASDSATIEKFDSAEQFAHSQAQKASASATVDKTRLEKSLSQDQAQAKLNSLIDGSRDKDLAESQAIRSGTVALDESGNAIRTEDGKLKATTGIEFTDALSMFGAGDMASNTQLIMGGQRVNIDTDMDGNVLINRDSQENLKVGRKQDTGLSGYPEHVAGMAGEALMVGAAGVAIAEGAARTMGVKNGIVKPLAKGMINQSAAILGFEKPFSPKPNETTDKTNNGDNSKTTDSPDSKKNDSIHDKPSKMNSKDNITQSGKTSKSSQSKIMESLEAKSLENEKLVMNGDMSDGEWVKKEMALDDVKQQVASGKVHSKQLKDVGLNPKDLQLEIGEKGFVDMEATDAKHQKVQTKLDNIKTNAPSTDIPKKLSIAEEIGAEYRKQTQLNANGAYNADLARLKDTHTEQIRLNGGVATPEMARRQSMEIGAMQDSHFDRLNQNKLTPVSNLLDNKGTSQGSWMSNLFKSMTSSSTPPIEIPTVSGGGKIKAIATLAALSTAGTVIASDDGVVGDVAKSVFKQSSTDSTLKNAVNAADASAEILDPTIAGYKTVKETATSVSNNIDSGNYLEAAKDVVKTPANFAKNVVNDGYKMGRSIHSLYDELTYDSPVLSKSEDVSTPQKRVTKAQAALKTLDSTSDSTLGQESVEKMIDSKIASLPSNSQNSNQHSSLVQLKNDVSSGSSVNPEHFSKAMEINVTDFAKNGVAISGTGENKRLDMDSIGTAIRPSLQNNIENSLSNARIEQGAMQNTSQSMAHSSGSMPETATNYFSNANLEDSIPQHIQNAFSTSPMDNTVSAMRNAYNDNTSNVNSTPGEYLAKDTSDMTRNLEDISMTSEFNQETSEGIREAVEKLSNPQNNNN